MMPGPSQKHEVSTKALGTRLEHQVNIELCEIYKWLCANKLSINIDKTNFVIFRSPQKRVNYVPKLFMNNMLLKQEDSIKYLGIHIDSHLNWKSQIIYILNCVITSHSQY